MKTRKRGQLDKNLKARWVWAIAFGSSIGWGAFILPTDWLQKSSPLAIAIGFFIGACLMIIISTSYGYLIKHYPVSGGEFTYAYIGFGRKHAYLAGWFLLLGSISIVALNASALGVLVQFLFPNIAKIGYMYSIAGWEVYAGQVIIICLALILFALLNSKGSSLSGRLEFYFCVLMILGIGFIVLSMFISPDTSMKNLTPAFKPHSSKLTTIFTVVAISPWAFVGFNNIPQAAEEFNFSPKKSFKLIVFALLASALAYSLMVSATAVSSPWTQLTSENSVWGAGHAINSILGKTGLYILSISLLMGVFTGLNGFYVSASRILFAMGRAQILPGFFAKLHPKSKMPYYSLYFICLVCMITPFFGREVLQWIVDMASLGMSIAYFYCCATVYKTIKWPQKHSSTQASVLLNKIGALLGMIITLGLIGLLIVPGSPGFLSKPSWVVLLIWIIIGIIFYLFRAKKFLKIPKTELDYYILGEAPKNDSI